MGAHGLIKVFGFFGGPGLDRFEQALRGFAFTRQLGPLSWLTGLTEVGGSALIPARTAHSVGAAGLLGVGASVVASKWSGGFFAGKGQEFELGMTLAAVISSVTLLLFR
jgi:putative oxidoreductase